MKNQVYYAVYKGKNPGVYTTWKECKYQVDGISGCKYRKFNNMEGAINYVKNGIDITDFFKIKNNIQDESNESEEEEEEEKQIEFVYTDGSCISNGKINAKGGIGVYFGKNDPRNISMKLVNKPTNNKAELTAIKMALEVLQNSKNKIYLYTDSNYSIKIFTNYIKNWKKNGWKTWKKQPVSNKDLIIEIDNLLLNMDVNFVHIASHTGLKDKHSIGNENADKLALSAALL